jgi:putative pyrimidine permease RutG
MFGRIKCHIAAISDYMGRDLNPYLGRADLGDAPATLVSSLGGGTPQTTYAENMGVMAMRAVFSTHNFIAAVLIVLLLGFCPKFGALIHASPVQKRRSVMRWPLTDSGGA